MMGLSIHLSHAGVSYVQFLLLDHMGMRDRANKSLNMTEVARVVGHSTAAATGMVVPATGAPSTASERIPEDTPPGLRTSIS
jgi:hypothetical protein